MGTVSVSFINQPPFTYAPVTSSNPVSYTHLDVYKRQHVMNRIYNELIKLFQTVPKGQTACVGLGIPGLLDIETGISKFSPNFPSWENVPVVDWLQAVSYTHLFPCFHSWRAWS